MRTFYPRPLFVARTALWITYGVVMSLSEIRR